MNPTRTQLFARLFVAFPDRNRDPGATTAVYLDALTDTPDDQLARGIADCIRLNKWFPSVRELRDASWRLDREPVTPPEYRIEPPRDFERPSEESKARVAAILEEFCSKSRRA